MSPRADLDPGAGGHVRCGDAGSSQHGCPGVRRRTQHRQTGHRSVKPMPSWTWCGQPNRDLGTGFEVRAELFWYSVSGFRRACSTRCYRTRCQHRRRSTQIRNRGRTSRRLGGRAIGLACIPPSGRRSGDNLFIHKVLDAAEPGVSVVNGSGDTTRAHRRPDPGPEDARIHDYDNAAIGTVFVIAGAVSRHRRPGRARTTREFYQRAERHSCGGRRERPRPTPAAPVAVGGVVVAPGDVVVADADGVVVSQKSADVDYPVDRWRGRPR